MNVQVYEALLHDEYRASGRMPRVAVIGEYDFGTLSGQLMTMFSVQLVAESEAPDKIEYKGIALYKCYAHKHGVWFGGREV